MNNKIMAHKKCWTTKENGEWVHYSSFINKKWYPDFPQYHAKYEIGKTTFPTTQNLPLMAWRSLQALFDDGIIYCIGFFTVLAVEVEESSVEVDCIRTLRKDVDLSFRSGKFQATSERRYYGVNILSMSNVILCKSITPLYEITREQLYNMVQHN